MRFAILSAMALAETARQQLEVALRGAREYTRAGHHLFPDGTPVAIR